MTFLLALASASWAVDYNYLTFTLNDGTTMSISASDLHIAFDNGNLKATSGTNTMTIALAKLTSMEFTNDSSTAIESIDADVTIDETTEIYDMNGRRLPSNAQLSRGVYMIKSNGQTTKVHVK